MTKKQMFRILYLLERTGSIRVLISLDWGPQYRRPDPKERYAASEPRISDAHEATQLIWINSVAT